MSPSTGGRYHDPIWGFFPKLKVHSPFLLLGSSSTNPSGSCTEKEQAPTSWLGFPLSPNPNSLVLLFHQPGSSSTSRGIKKPEIAPKRSRALHAAGGGTESMDSGCASVSLQPLPATPQGSSPTSQGFILSQKPPNLPLPSSSAPNRAEHCSNSIKIWDFWGVKCGTAPAPTHGRQDGGTDPPWDHGMGHNPTP